jgi:hypothetical protein
VTEILQKQYCFTGKKPKWVQQRFKKLVAFVKKNTNKPEGHKPWKKYKFQLSQDNFFCTSCRNLGKGTVDTGGVYKSQAGRRCCTEAGAG